MRFKWIFALGAIMCVFASEVAAQGLAPMDYFRPWHVGNYWKYYNVRDTTNATYVNWNLREAVSDTLFGMAGEIHSFAVEHKEMELYGGPSDAYVRYYYTINDDRDLCISGMWDSDGNTVRAIDPLWVYLRNPINAGDSILVHFSYGDMDVDASVLVVSITDTVQLPIGLFTNCLRIHETWLIDGQLNEEADIYFAPDPVYGMVKEGRIYWYSYPDSFRYGYSYLAEYSVDPDLSVGTLLQNYSAVLSGAGITLAWTLSELDNGIAFFIERASALDGPYADLPCAEMRRDGLSFTFTDKDIGSGASYRYRVGYSRGTQRIVLFETSPVATPALPLTLYQNQPNPFNPSTTIRYYLPQSSRVRLEVYDASGRRVRTLVDEMQQEGSHSVEWAGNNEQGVPVSSGMYFCRLSAGKEIISKKMVLLR
jgi:hypothetical protein